MKKPRIVLTKLVLSLLASLMIAGTFHIGAETEGSAISFRVFAAARGAASSTANDPAEEARLQEQYDAAQALFEAKEYDKAAEAFEALGKFSDSRARAGACKRAWKVTRYKEAKALYLAEQYTQAKEIFETLGNFEESRYFLYKCNITLLRADYRRAEELLAAGDYENAKDLFESLGTFHDSPKRAQAVSDMIKAGSLTEKERAFYEKAVALKASGDLEGAFDAFIEAGDCQDATEQLYSISRVFTMRTAYQKAEADYANGDYENAYDRFQALGDFEDSADKAALSKEAWQAAVYEHASAVQNSIPPRAYFWFLRLGDYLDSAEIVDRLRSVITEQSVYALSKALAEEGDDEQAMLGFASVSSYADSQERAAKLSKSVQQEKDYKQALLLREIGEEEQANALFKSLGRFRDASKMVVPVTPKFTAKQLRDYRTSEKSPEFTSPDGTKHIYQTFKGVTTWEEAKAFCEVLGGHLATLTSAEEDEYVYAFVRENGYLTAYFGLSDLALKGNWEWVTGEPFVYSNWHPGEPNRGSHRGVYEKYGMYLHKYLDGTWNDSHFYENEIFSNDDELGCSYVCEWDA